MATQTGLETEVKIRVVDQAHTQKNLALAGFRVSVARSFEVNTLYDTADSTLKRAQMLLRLRQIDDECIITWKGPSVPGPHKSRPELETKLASPLIFDQILKALGYEPTFRYEKYRTEYRQPEASNDGVVMLDETPIGNFMELEGASSWIDAVAALLGFEPRQYVLASYGKLYLDYCAAKGVPPSNMIFATKQ